MNSLFFFSGTPAIIDSSRSPFLRTMDISIPLLLFLIFILILLLLFLRCLAVLAENKRLRTSCTNMCALLGIAELDYFILDANGNYQLRPQNNRFWKFKDGLPLPPKDCIVPEDVENYKYQYRQLLDGKANFISINYRISSPDGLRTFSLRAMPVRSKRKHFFIGTVQEITTSVPPKSQA